MRKYIFIFSLFVAKLCMANNIQVNNVSVVPANNTIKFTISWDNGWRSSVLNNWDAAWVFLKYYNPSTFTWDHLYYTNTGNVIPSGFTTSMGQTGAQNVGVFLYRSASGAGTTTITDIELGIPALQATGVFDIKVFAIEMVYVPQGAFYVGDGISGAGRFGASNTLAGPALISSGSSTAAVYDPLLNGAGGFLSGLPAAYPNGFNAFYCMKYELSQGAYKDFLNCLTYNQQVNHTATLPNAAATNGALIGGGGNRNFIEIKTSGVATTTPAVYGLDADGDNIYDEITDGEWVACGFINWPDQAAYLAWSGLRPLSELEFEKACRGIQLPVSGEYAWGNVNVAASIYTLSNAYAANEIVSNSASSPTGNAVYSSTNPSGPIRNGVFATATSNRISSGAGFYGVMEMSGNLIERVISTAQNTTPNPFTGQHGDGTLTVNVTAALEGYATVAWPGFNSSVPACVNGLTTAVNLMTRGGSWGSLSSEIRTSNRTSSLLFGNPGTTRFSDFGCRGARTAP